MSAPITITDNSIIGTWTIVSGAYQSDTVYTTIINLQEDINADKTRFTKLVVNHKAYHYTEAASWLYASEDGVSYTLLSSNSGATGKTVTHDLSDHNYRYLKCQAKQTNASISFSEVYFE